MEYLVGSISTLIVIIIAYKVLQNNAKNEPDYQIQYSQSRIFEMIKPAREFLDFSQEKETIISQAQKIYNKNNIRIVLVENKAYWIQDNQFLVADVIDGNIDEESTKTVDTMAMDKVELDKMMFIVERLTEGR